ncbi:MAG: hypothetical protein M9894_12315 [Planctomycetes bacterium]|nr:hypothetical protein [Planctomycetota bacterium]
MKARALVPSVLLLLAGCPDPGAAPPVADVAPAASATPAAPASATPADPLAGGVFSREEVLEIFRAEHAAGADGTAEAAAAKARVLKRHRLVDDEGREVAPRARAYERALQALAADQEAWAAFVESLGR